MFEEGPVWCESRNLLLATSTVTTLGTGDSSLITHVRWLKVSLRTAGGVLPQCCQINGADNHRHLPPLQLDWRSCTQPLSCLTAGEVTENGDEQIQPMYLAGRNQWLCVQHRADRRFLQAQQFLTAPGSQLAPETHSQTRKTTEMLIVCS